MTEKLQKLQNFLVEKLADLNVVLEIQQGELVAVVPAESLKKTVKILRDNKKCQFQQVMDITAVDYPDREARFDVVYNFLSITLNQRIRVIVRLADDTPIDSLMPYYRGADWFEREAWDMFGISFKGHPDLRRILTDYGFDGHPLRKDFPMTGFVEMRYDETQKRCIYEPVTLQQDFRTFDFLSPWEGMTTVQLPGDEKAGNRSHKPAFMPDENKG
jgi:NADH-quinone oxidoreductase subunit C